MSKPTFGYTIYIASTLEKVFKALTDSEMTAKFWFGIALTSDRTVGAPLAIDREGKLIVQGRIVAYDPPHRLSYTFQSMHEPLNGSEPPSRVTMEIENQRDASNRYCWSRQGSCALLGAANLTRSAPLCLCPVSRGAAHHR